ncbi:alpha/beta fold hydrolase [Falsiroseomonas selenitidurans]|uniref:Alpha/beta fold hydrolase n=1 Tax=Falsiroseomonas selenitidurans TaxID=2716335 RepID=A0ABX1E449_9PROT|nr:alpha/beta fold hydrolase [Falsiroseomonas selenitidurans]NKC31776.1 alpha/beta fold hydrolase [Falsiroseomonas selenitidurans]
MTAPPVLLLLPGLLCDSRLWRDQVAAFSPSLRCVVADLALDDNLGSMAARALDAVPGDAPICLLGLSMGGYVALEVMRRAPSRIARLALMDTSARPDTPEQARRRRGLLALSRSGQFRGVTPRLLPQLLHPEHLAGPLGEEVRAMAERLGREAFARQQRAILARPDSRPGLCAIRVPTLVAVGEADVLTPPELAAEIAAGIPGASLHRIPRTAHLPPMEDPPAVNALLHAWLAPALAAPQHDPA